MFRRGSEQGKRGPLASESAWFRAPGSERMGADWARPERSVFRSTLSMSLASRPRTPEADFIAIHIMDDGATRASTPFLGESNSRSPSKGPSMATDSSGQG